MTQRYNLILTRRVEELNISYLQYFEVAHQAIFGRVGSLNDDYAQFLTHAIVPKYVQTFLDKEPSNGSNQVHNVQSHGADGSNGQVPPPADGQEHVHPS